MPPESLGDKFCRLDINMIVDGQRVNLEIQVQDEGDFPERVLFHWARVYSSALAQGRGYTELPRTVIISIINFNQFNCEEFHSEFKPLETTRHELLSDNMSLHFFELKKLPEEISAGSKLLLWLALFRAETEEELKKIESMEVPVMKQAINAYHQITVTPEFREAERLRSIARHNEASALSRARDEERKQVDAKWQNVVAKKDTVIADKNAENEQLRSQITELQSKLKKLG
jgi:predicted transposase/invertase (TIGR01784 family)